MFELHNSERRGHSNHGWLDSRHSFTFAEHYDAQNMSFGSLRVINEDRIQGGTGFNTHGHRDMEIISYVLDGELAHRDSIGNGSVIRPGDVQRMSAGQGVMHSEYNHSKEQSTHFLQIWIEPNVRGIPAGYEQKYFTPTEKRGRLRLILSPDGRDGSLNLHQDACVYAGLFDGGESAVFDMAAGRIVYLHVARGAIVVNGTPLKAGDALKVVHEREIRLEQGHQAEVLLFDLV
jgi:redox-sensitive bicupin YhaK (pirin superfamily)